MSEYRSERNEMTDTAQAALLVRNVIPSDGRMGTWTGKSPAEAICKAEEAIEKWCFLPEMEQFEQANGLDWRVEQDDGPYGAGTVDFPE